MQKPVTGQALYAHVREKLRIALGDRTWKWLAEASGIPPSTLSSQMTRPKFSLDVLVRVAHTLGKEVSHFLPDQAVSASGQSQEALLDELEKLVSGARRQVGDPQIPNRTTEIRKSGA